jgi:hypothetical protein
MNNHTTKDFDLSRDAKPDQVVTKLRGLGIVRIQNYLKDVSPIKDELLDIFNQIPNPNYQFGKAIRTDAGPDESTTFPLDKCANIVKFFKKSQWKEDIARGYQSLKMGFAQDIFSTYDYVHDKGLATQGWVHFDLLQRFKFFLHVTDLDEDNGCFCAALGSHKLTPELRKRNSKPQWRFGRYSGDDGIPGPLDDKRTEGSQNHFPDIEYELTPMTGLAGTLLIFDSDIFHKGGTVQEGKERIVVRSHSW